MPYIRDELRPVIDLDRREIQMPGELNYAITRLVDAWLERQGVTYTTLNAAIGVLECAKLELYRRVAVPYEDQKLADNGDVYRSIDG